MLNEYAAIIWILVFLLLLALLFLYACYNTLKRLNEHCDELEVEHEKEIKTLENRYFRKRYHFNKLRDNVKNLIDQETNKKSPRLMLSKREIYATLQKFVAKK